MKPVIERVDFSESLFADLLDEAPAEDGAFLLRLRDGWSDGTLRFEEPGELLLGAFVEDTLVGVGGVSFDPYAPAPGLGRIRHLYVLRSHRRQGIGRALLDRLIQHGRRHFSVLRLSTQAPEAVQLYESCGFVRAFGYKQTHQLEL